MTMDEFLKLEYGSVVISKSNPEEEYEIIDTDVFGESYRGREYCVLGARGKITHRDIRIDRGNLKYWDIANYNMQKGEL